MKLLIHLIVTIAFLFCSEEVCGIRIQSCLETCADSNRMLCLLFRERFCSNIFRFFCQQTCGICTPCPESELSRNLKAGDEEMCNLDCADKRPEFACVIAKERRKDGCEISGDYCRKTCGYCTPCELPPSPPAEEPCSFDCADRQEYVDKCEGWKKMDYCTKGSSKYSPGVRTACPLTCGICIRCNETNETLERSLRLEKMQCTNDPECKDTSEHCQDWWAEGYCAEGTKYTEGTHTVCPVACEVCKPCSPPAAAPAPRPGTLLSIDNRFLMPL